MEKITKFLPAWDKRSTNPNKNYGIHGVDLLMILKGEYGAVEFTVYTHWNLPHVQAEFLEKHNDKFDIAYFLCPDPNNLGYHSKEKRYSDQDVACETCQYCDREPCYVGGTGIGAEKAFNILVKEGSDAVWTFLEKYYVDIFGELK